MKNFCQKINIKKNIITILCLGISFGIVAQNETDALRYSQTTIGGTAKFMSMGGAWGAIGGEISSLSYNPAGIGLYRRSEAVITPTIFLQNVTSAYNGSNDYDNKLNLNLENIGIIFSNNRGNDDRGLGWMTFNLGLVYNKTNNFNGRISIDGSNSSSSLLNSFVNNSNGLLPSHLEPFSSQLAYSTYLTDTIPGTLDYSSRIPTGAALQQKKTIETSGSTGETALSAGGNYLNKLFLGITVGFTNINYAEQSTYSEVATKDSISFVYNNSLATKGNGFNFKFGIIYQAADWLRLGGAIHSSTYYYLTDNWSSDLTANFRKMNHVGLTYSSNSPLGIYDYRLTTPLKMIGSIGFRIKKKGLIDFDYEYVDYSSSSLSSSPNAFIDANAAIRNKIPRNTKFTFGYRMDNFAI